MTPEDQEAYNQVAYYTLTLGDPAFIHQYAVDAFAAQTADAATKPIKLAFALAGLYLANVRGWSGREVQLAHMRMAKVKKQWPIFDLPARRGEVTAKDVMEAPAGPERDAAIRAWSACVWQAYAISHEKVANWTENESGI